MASLQDYAFQQARLRNLDPTFVSRLIRAESAWNPTAVSPAGARGLMQIMPGTGGDLGLTTREAFFNPQQNIQAGTQYLSQLSRQFGGNPYLMAAAYNAGPGRVGGLVKRYGANPTAIYPHLPAETRNYVTKVAGPLGGVASVPQQRVQAAPVPPAPFAGVSLSPVRTGHVGGAGVPAPALRRVVARAASPFTFTMPLFSSFVPAFSPAPVASPIALAAPAPAFTLNDVALLDLPRFGGLSI